MIQANGNALAFARYIVTDIDLFGAGSLSFTLNFTDGTSDNITLKGVYNYVSAPKSFKDYSESAKEGYLNTELKPESSWRITASSAKSSPDRYLDGDATESHSYYEHNGAFVLRYSAPHYVVIDTGKTSRSLGSKICSENHKLGRLVGGRHLFRVKRRGDVQPDR